jgi:predicted DNA-binding ribbon-helix-helix protein
MKKSLIVKRSIVVGGHKTSVSLEDEFWAALKKIAVRHRVTLSDLVGSIDCALEFFRASSVLLARQQFSPNAGSPEAVLI